MAHAEERRQVTAEVFAATGKKCAEDDPIIVAALFQAHTIRKASLEAVARIAEAGKSVQVVVEDAREAAANAIALARQAAADGQVLVDGAAADRKALSAAMAAERKRLADVIDQQVKKSIREASRGQSGAEGPPQGWRGVFAGIAFGLLLAGGLISIACGFSSSWFADARIGAEMRRVVPNLPSAFRDQLLEYLQKPPR